MSEESFDSEAVSGESIEDTRQTDEEKGKNKKKMKIMIQYKI